MASFGGFPTASRWARNALRGGVVARGDVAREVERPSDVGASAPDVAFAAVGSRVAGLWGEACEARHLAVIALAQFGQ